MRKLSKNKLVVLVLLIPSVSFAWLYTVQPGDTLSRIVRKNFKGAVYGKNGELQNVLAVNPSVKNPDLVFPGEKIELSSSVAETKVNSDANRVIASEKTEAAPQVSENAQSEKVAYLSFSPDFDSTKLSSIDRASGAGATLLSKSNVGFTLAYGHHWSEKFSTEFHFGFKNIQFNQPTGAIALKDDSVKLYRFGVNALYAANDRLSIFGGVAINQNIYLRALSLSQINLDSISAPQFSAGLQYLVFRQGSLSLLVDAGAALSASASTDTYQTNWNASYFADLMVAQKISQAFSSEVGVDARYSSQDASIVNQAQTDYGIFARIKWFFGEAQ